MAKQLILVTGATGYIAGKLIPRLLDEGYRVRCMVRNASKMKHHPWVDQVEMVAADITQPDTLPAALQQVDTAYYLIHNMSSGHGYQRIELEGAENFARAAAQAEIKHIIYLGGLADPHAKIAPHMRSRIETGETLRKHPVPVTEFRAGVIVGPGSISFEMIRYLCEQFPILLGPAWLRNHTQPISAENVVDYLMAALKNENGQGQIFEIGGLKKYTYAETMQIYGQIRDLRRWLLTVPSLPLELMAYLVGKLTPVPSAIAYPLIEGLKSHSEVTDPKALEVFPEIELSGYHQAVQHSLTQLHPFNLERIWINQPQQYLSLKSEGFLIECYCVKIAKPEEEIFPALKTWANQVLEKHDLEENHHNTRLLFKENAGNPGRRWIEWELLSHPGSGPSLRQTSYFAPRGLTGFLSSPGWKIRQRRLLRELLKHLGESYP